MRVRRARGCADQRQTFGGVVDGDDMLGMGGARTINEGSQATI